MTDEIAIGDRCYYKHLGEWRLKAHNGGAYDTYTNECCSPLLDEIERLRKECHNWRTASERIAGDLEKSDDEVERLRAVLESALGFAHVAALFNGGRSEGNLIAGLMEWAEAHDNLIKDNEELRRCLQHAIDHLGKWGLFTTEEKQAVLAEYEQAVCDD